MSDWENFKPVNSERNNEDSKTGLIVAWISTTILSGFAGAVIIWYVLVRGASRSRTASSASNISIETINGITTAGFVVGLIGGAVFGLFIFGPALIGKNKQES